MTKRKKVMAIVDEAKDVHTEVTEKMFEGTRTGRFRSDQPNEANGPKADEPALQNIPLRTEEARELRNAFAEDSKLITPTDFSSVEMRVAAELGLDITQTPEEQQIARAMGLGGVAQGVSDAYDREKPYGGGLPRNAAVLRDDEHLVGRRSSRMADTPIGIVVSRKVVVQRAMAKLGRDKLQMIANYKGIPANSNHKMRRIKQSLHRRIMKFLPRGITLDEAMAVLP